MGEGVTSSARAGSRAPTQVTTETDAGSANGRRLSRTAAACERERADKQVSSRGLAENIRKASGPMSAGELRTQTDAMETLGRCGRG